MIYFGVTYTKIGQLKMYNRVVPSSLSLPPEERSVLLFILQRTVGWGKMWEAISPVQFERGVFRRSGGKRHVIVRGTGLPYAQVSQAIAILRAMGAADTEEYGSRTVYRIIPEWLHSDLREGAAIWEVNEADIMYHEA